VNTDNYCLLLKRAAGAYCWRNVTLCRMVGFAQRQMRWTVRGTLTAP